MTQERIKLTSIVETPPAMELSETVAPAPARRLERGAYVDDVGRGQGWIVTGGLAATVFWFGMWAAWPIGDVAAHLQLNGTLEGWSSPVLSWPVLMLIVFVPVFLWLTCFMVIKTLQFSDAATALAHAADRMLQPETTSAQEIASVGEAVRDHVERLNEGLEIAVARLASAEEIIQQHSTIIEEAGVGLETKASGAVAKLVRERDRLAEMTQGLNEQADDIAAALAKSADGLQTAGADVENRFKTAETSLSERIEALGAAAETAVKGCADLGGAIARHTSALEETSIAAEGRVDGIVERLEKQRSALEGVSREVAENSAALSSAAAEQMDAARTASEAAKTAEAARAAEDDIAPRLSLRTSSPLQNKETERPSDKAGDETFDLKVRRGLETQTSPQQQKRESALDSLKKLDVQLSELRKVSDERRGHVRQVLEEQLAAIRSAADAAETDAEDARRAASDAPTPEQSEPQAPNQGSPSSVQRLSVIAEDIAARRAPKSDAPPPSAPVAAPPPQDGIETDFRKKANSWSWRDVLAAADKNAEEDASLTQPPASNGAQDAPGVSNESIAASLQDATLEIERRLYGEPPRGLMNRFLAGERDVFAERLLRLNEADFKKRLRAHMGADRTLEDIVRGYLANFDTLLDLATTGSDADERMEAMLKTALGKTYVLIGGAIGYFE